MKLVKIVIFFLAMIIIVQCMTIKEKNKIIVEYEGQIEQLVLDYKIKVNECNELRNEYHHPPFEIGEEKKEEI